MNRWIRYPLMVSGIGIAMCPALFAAPSGVASVKCATNQDRVWVYDSLTSFDIEAKIPCGDTVQIVSRVKGYVKIRTASGLDGYVPDSTFPDLPPFQDQQYDLGNHNAATSETVVNDPSDLGAIAAAYRARRIAAESSATASAAVAPAPAAPAVTETPTEVASAVAPQAAPAVVPAPAAPIEARRKAAMAPVATKPTVIATRVSAPVPAAPVVASIPAVVASMASPAVMDPPIPVPSAMPPAAAPADASMREIAAKTIGTMPEPDEYPDTLPENASADPSCRVYFSAYGLGAEQYKWLSDTRQKQFSGICPAPNLKSVDFVILFTHDTDSYISAMPTPVHTDGSGFSDFDPMTTVDTALMSPTEADKAHYELAWVFRVKRGGFDPSEFSPRRRPQYTNTLKGAHASTKAVEDAFSFIEQQGPAR
ncbi:MAG TPA: SH3 domain-containing protein [Candidatus Acidoferrales bacterium]|jgi:hypothetical protein|nr:SH3 domain-containing protein [Candidatus Acidoferrales bacterium]